MAKIPAITLRMMQVGALTISSNGTKSLHLDKVFADPELRTRFLKVLTDVKECLDNNENPFMPD